LRHSVLQPFNDLFSTTVWISRYQKGKTSLDLSEARIAGVLGWLHCHQLDHMQTAGTSLQTDNHANTSSVNFWHNRSSTVLFCTQSGNNRGRDADSRRWPVITPTITVFPLIVIPWFSCSPADDDWASSKFISPHGN